MGRVSCLLTDYAPPLGAIPRDHAFEIFILSITSNLGKIGNVQLTRPKTSGPIPLPLSAIKLCVSLDLHSCSEDHTITGRVGSTVMRLKSRWALVPGPRAEGR